MSKAYHNIETVRCRRDRGQTECSLNNSDGIQKIARPVEDLHIQGEMFTNLSMRDEMFSEGDSVFTTMNSPEDKTISCRWRESDGMLSCLVD